MQAGQLKIGDQCLVYLNQEGIISEEGKATASIVATVFSKGEFVLFFGWKNGEPKPTNTYDRGDDDTRSISYEYIDNASDFIYGCCVILNFNCIHQIL
jgi:hypothetical protein